MTPEQPTDPKGVRIGDVEGEPSAEIPSIQRGQTTTVSVRLQFLEDERTQSARYHRLKQYQQYAGEASLSNQLGGKPTLREHPQDYWPVASHVVPIVYGDEIYDARDVWALIQGVDDSDTVIVDEAASSSGLYDEDLYSDGTYDSDPTPSPNIYRVAIDIVPLAAISEYSDRQELLADLSPVLSQM